MKQFVLMLMIAFCSSVACEAQTYLEHLKQNAPGLGKVTVHQSKEIDELVNGKQVVANTNKTTPQDDKTKTTPLKKDNMPQHKQEIDSMKKAEQHHETTANKENNAPKADKQKEETEMPVVDMRKKVMRKSYKVTGYRVQAYAGGNSRNDRLQAEQTGNALKMKFPDQPVYVHFYSPRWICRMGNFKNLTDAQKMLAKVRALGYKQACLVKGQITVQY